MRGKKEDWKIIALCFIGATIFWFFNALNKQYNASIRYPVEFVFNRDSTVIVNELPDNIRLDVSGGGWDLLRKTFWFDIDPVIISLENPTGTEYLSREFLDPIVKEQIGQIEINQVVTDTIRLHIEKRISKTIPIKIDTARIRLGQGMKIASKINLVPDSVTVIGPASQIEAMSDTFLISLYNSQIDENFEDELNLESFLPRLVRAVPEQIDVQFNVKKYMRARVAVAVETINFPSNSQWVLEDSTLVISVEAPEERIDDIKPQDFTLLADYRKLNPRDLTIEPFVVAYPEFVSDVNIDTSKVHLKKKSR